MKISSLTDIGNTREMNQDYLYSSEESVGKLPNLFLVADGMGGHKAGEFASRYVGEHIVRSIKGSKEEEAVGILSESIETANRKLKEYADAHQQMRGMGTTIVAAVIQGRTLLVANVGDSRLYIVGDEITQVTQDHSLVQEMVRLGQMDPQSAKNHPDKNIITRAVGVSEKVKIDIFERQLRAGEYIILCSDGLTNMVEDSVILQILHGAGSLSDKAERLIELADKILLTWRGYTDEDAFIYAETDGEPHNTITPIARRRGDDFELDLVLRNNITTGEHPLGVYHPHAKLHHIKKENIGLIEVMGLAVLPARLKEELELLGEYILEGKDISSNEKIEKHAAWAAQFLPKYDNLDKDNIQDVLRKEVGNVFVHVLEDAGVYKCTAEGREAFMRFISQL